MSGLLLDAGPPPANLELAGDGGVNACMHWNTAEKVSSSEKRLQSQQIADRYLAKKPEIGRSRSFGIVGSQRGPHQDDNDENDGGRAYQALRGWNDHGGGGQVIRDDSQRSKQYQQGTEHAEWNSDTTNVGQEDGYGYRGSRGNERDKMPGGQFGRNGRNVSPNQMVQPTTGTEGPESGHRRPQGGPGGHGGYGQDQRQQHPKAGTTAPAGYRPGSAEIFDERMCYGGIHRKTDSACSSKFDCDVPNAAAIRDDYAYTLQQEPPTHQMERFPDDPTRVAKYASARANAEKSSKEPNRQDKKVKGKQGTKSDMSTRKDGPRNTAGQKKGGKKLTEEELGDPYIGDVIAYRFGNKPEVDAGKSSKQKQKVKSLPTKASTLRDIHNGMKIEGDKQNLWKMEKFKQVDRRIDTFRTTRGRDQDADMSFMNDTTASGSRQSHNSDEDTSNNRRALAGAGGRDRQALGKGSKGKGSDRNSGRQAGGGGRNGEGDERRDAMNNGRPGRSGQAGGSGGTGSGGGSGGSGGGGGRSNFQNKFPEMESEGCDNPYASHGCIPDMQPDGSRLGVSYIHEDGEPTAFY